MTIRTTVPTHPFIRSVHHAGCAVDGCGRSPVDSCHDWLADITAEEMLFLDTLPGGAL